MFAVDVLIHLGSLSWTGGLCALVQQFSLAQQTGLPVAERIQTDLLFINSV